VHGRGWEVITDDNKWESDHKHAESAATIAGLVDRLKDIAEASECMSSWAEWPSVGQDLWISQGDANDMELALMKARKFLAKMEAGET
jgi:hypothetical protein